MAGTDTLRISFFEECEDLLVRLGEGLGRMAEEGDRTDIETIHDVFRAVHSMKGGGAAFGLTSLVSFAHLFETVLDLMRSNKLAPDSAAMHTLLRAYDVLSDLVAAARDDTAEPSQMQQLLAELDSLAESDNTSASVDESFDFQPLPLNIFQADDADSATTPVPIDYVITFAPQAGLYATGHEPAALLRSLQHLGEADVTAELDEIPILSEMDLDNPHLRWRMHLSSHVSLEEIEGVFDFIGDLAQITIMRVARDALTQNVDVTLEPEPIQSKQADAPLQTNETQARRISPEGNAAATPPMATIRVNLNRVDRLINQIGEMVIMEAMLSQAISSAGLRDDSDIVSSLEGMKQLAANIQESVMSIRAQPLKSVFQRMERISREASDATGKQIRLLTSGESTEVDKTVIERLVDPLTHMIRNSVDHGVESAAMRLAAGKPAEGQIRLSAAHRSGRVIIEVADDGGGVDRTRVREIAEARGLIAPGVQLSVSEIDNLLFMPGFSSKDEVSALSGRGVGLDVVRREIQSLGGRVAIQSVPGQGTTFTIALPLTLAVLEGMLIGVGRETMVLPLSSIIETLRPREAQIHRLGRTGRLIANRGEMIPVIDLAGTFGFEEDENPERSVLILVECDSGRRAALCASHIVDQRQVVIKSLEDNYGSVPGISAATILGDGRIALIIDPEEIVQRATIEPQNLSLAANG